MAEQQAHSLTDYQVLFDGGFVLDASSPTEKERTFNFAITNDIVISSDFRKPILAFHVGPIEETRFKVFVNSHQILSWHLGVDATKGMWSPFSANPVFPEGQSFPNPVPVRILVTEGRIKFEHIILWYQVKGTLVP